MGVLSNKVDREQLKPGDHIYSWRQLYVYAHHGIYFGDRMVIHFTRGVGQEVGTGTILDRLLVSSVPPHDTSNPCPICGDQSKKEGVISSCLDCFLYGGTLYLFEYGVSPAFFLAKARGGTCTRAPFDPIEDVLHRASFLLEHGFGGYDLFKKNCEDFAIYCKTGLLVRSEQAASYSAAANAVVSTAIRFMFTASSVSCPAMVGYGMYSYCVSRLVSDIGVRNDAFKVPVESLLASPGLNESKKTAEAPVEGLIASPGLNEPEKTAEVPVEMLIASPGLNEPEKTAEVPVESLKASPGFNEPEKIVEVPMEMIIASPSLNELEKTTEVPMENLMASPSLNEPEKTTKTPKENQHWSNRGSGNRGGRFGYRGGGRGRGGRRPSATCQVCLKSGHSAYNCLKASPGLNEPEKTAEVPVEMLIASPDLNELEKTTEVPMENLMASPGLNEPEKTTKTAKENQHWLNRGSGNRGGRFGYRDGGCGRRGRRPSVSCQVCLKSGHSAYNCYYRFDYNNLPRQSPQPVFPPGFRPHNAHLAAMPTTPQVLNDKSWFPDSGATNHVTADRENLVQRSEYNGPEQLFVGNGRGLHIAQRHV